ncbi:MAG TPA: hypothetical protein VG148_11050 [Pyrinomonadaceae bacterium]|nr:hypothetical protein [Pyrinomonadaceae bacterium]
MSEKKRQKKDGRRVDKKNQARRERENEVVQDSSPPLKGRDQSNFTETQPGAADVSGRNKGR